jgi:hypothetical protein
VATGQGTIVFQTPGQPIYYAPTLIGSNNLDLNGDGVTDFALGFDLSRAYLVPQLSNSLVVIPTLPDVAPLNPGQTVSANPSSLDPTYRWYDPATDTSGLAFLGAQAVFDGQLFYSGYWSGRDAFVGLRFQYGGETHYGWMEINNYVGVAAGQVLGWAYETRPDTPIFAGAVPEPSTLSLLLACGAALWLVRKRL